jgi:hypothetical protein
MKVEMKVEMKVGMKAPWLADKKVESLVVVMGLWKVVLLVHQWVDRMEQRMVDL